ncbi:MAG: MFS transporter [Deltaproteobacteria bacterium]|nr:MAG: MFS transporter [Deltaproteobacteria bacterium]
MTVKPFREARTSAPNALPAGVHIRPAAPGRAARDSCAAWRAAKGHPRRPVAAGAPSDLRGTAFGVFNLTTGVVLLLASVVAGLLWSRLGPSATFLAGAIFAAVAMAGLVLVNPARRLMPPAGDMSQDAARSSSRQHTR